MRAMTSGRLAVSGITERPDPPVEPEDLVLDVYRRWRESASPAQGRSAPFLLAVITRLCHEHLRELEQ